MPEQATGRISYANGVPARGVRVRVLDSDIGGGDDDLTVEAGVSDAAGSFSVTYDPARARDTISVTTLEPRSWSDWTLVQKTRQVADPLDVYLPYLELSYELRGQAHTVRHTLGASPHDIRLEEPPPVDGRFVPSRHGFMFANFFSGTPLPFTIPSLPGLDMIPSSYGLCGGMSAAAADWFYAGRQPPVTRLTPTKRTGLYRYLLRRQMDSFSPAGEPVLRFMRWMRLDEQAPLGTWERTTAELTQLRGLLDAGLPAHPIGLVFAGPGDPMWENHQVLACGYAQTSPTRIDIHVYDPNYPGNDQVVIRCDLLSLRGQGSDGQGSGGQAVRCRRVAVVAGPDGGPVEDVRPMRGMFLMPYAPVAPPPEL